MDGGILARRQCGAAGHGRIICRIPMAAIILQTLSRQVITTFLSKPDYGCLAGLGCPTLAKLGWASETPPP